MKKTTIIRAGVSVELCEYVEDYYLISERANKNLKQLRIGLPTWVSSEVYNQMNISVWVYHETNVNAFCYFKEGKNYIALSVGLLDAFWKLANDFVNQEKLSVVFKLREDNKPYIIDTLYFYMLNFSIAHEFGHIAHGHLREGARENGIDEFFYISSKKEDERKKEYNWLTQLKEYDADSFAVAIQSMLFLQQWNETDIKANLSNFDKLFIANYLCFKTFAEKAGRCFDMYFAKDIADYDHPHPGIRMYYSFILYSDWIGRVRGFGEDTIAILISGSHAVITYEKSVLEKQEIKECYYSVAYTEKGVQHLMNLNNGWQEMIDYYNQFAYIPIEKIGDLAAMPVSVDENGYFIKNNKEA